MKNITQEIKTKRARVKSIDTSLGSKPKTNSALMSLLIAGICVPIYASVNNVPLDYIPYNGEHLNVEYVEKDGKIIVKAYKRQNNVTYCSAL